MNRSKKVVLLVSSLVLFLLAAPALADQSSVEIDAPETAKKGSTITVKIKVIHKGNNYLHHTDWVYVKVNDKEVARWDYSLRKLPEDEVFTKEVEVKVDGPLDIRSQAHCNIHGSSGEAKAKVEVK